MPLKVDRGADSWADDCRRGAGMGSALSNCQPWHPVDTDASDVFSRVEAVPAAGPWEVMETRAEGLRLGQAHEITDPVPRCKCGIPPAVPVTIVRHGLQQE